MKTALDFADPNGDGEVPVLTPPASPEPWLLCDCEVSTEEFVRGLNEMDAEVC